jgi:hypothetical protein
MEDHGVRQERALLRYTRDDPLYRLITAPDKPQRARGKIGYRWVRRPHSYRGDSPLTGLLRAIAEM